MHCVSKSLLFYLCDIFVRFRLMSTRDTCNCEVEKKSDELGNKAKHDFITPD